MSSLCLDIWQHFSYALNLKPTLVDFTEKASVFSAESLDTFEDLPTKNKPSFGKIYLLPYSKYFPFNYFSFFYTIN